MIIMELILNELQKAVMENVTGGFGSQGGSTITQQVVKNYFLTMDKTAKKKSTRMVLILQIRATIL